MRPKLLIAEGDHSWRRGLQVLFANRGWEVALASTVAEGLALLDPRLDFLILDWALPDAGGGVILRRVRDAGLRTRVAVTTGTSNADQQREVRDLRPEAVFEKPVNVADVWREAG
jgi:DNA-binding response OmpR family regulator